MTRNRCRHISCGYSSVSKPESRCDAGVSLYELCKVKELGVLGCALRLPCHGKGPGTKDESQIVCECESYDSFTDEEIEAENKEMERRMDCISRGVSACCGAEIDRTQTIKTGQYKGHGRYYCSKCGKVAFMV